MAGPCQPWMLASLLSLLAWFCWPAGPLALWTLWRWRRHGLRRHITVPATAHAGTAGEPASAMDGSERALLLALPSLAILAAFALADTEPRLLSGGGLVLSLLLQRGGTVFLALLPVDADRLASSRPLANLRRLAEGFEPQLQRCSLWCLPLAATAAVAGPGALANRKRHRHALWKSLALPAGGVALGWLLVTSLLLPPLDYARSLDAAGRRDSRRACRSRCNLPGRSGAEPGHAGSAGMAWRLAACEGKADRWQPPSCSYCRSSPHGPAHAARAGSVIAQVKRPTDRSGSASLVLLKRQ